MRGNLNEGLIVEQRLGLVLLLLFAPTILLSALLLLLTGHRRILRQKEWRGRGVPFETTAFETRDSAIGEFLSEMRIDDLPALFDVALGRVQLVLDWSDGGRLTMEMERPSGLTERTDRSHFTQAR